MEYSAKDDYRVRIPDGVYEAQCFKYDSGFCLGKARKLFLHYRITEGEHTGTELFQAFNMPYQGKVSCGSKYYKTYVMVNGWTKPSRNAKLSPRLFKDKIFKVRTRTVQPQHAGKPMPEQFWYSVVDDILEVCA